MRQIIKKYLIVSAILFAANFSNTALAQGPDPGCDPCCEAGLPPTPDCELVICPPQCVPIDGGLSLLIAAGVGLGARRAYRRRKEKQVKAD